MWPALLLLMWGGVSLAGSQCERSSAVRFSVSSWRNQTGHRLVATQLRPHDFPQNEVSLIVDQWTEQCGATAIVALGVLTGMVSSTSTLTESDEVPATQIRVIPDLSNTVPTTPIPSTVVPTSKITIAQVPTSKVTTTPVPTSKVTTTPVPTSKITTTPVPTSKVTTTPVPTSKVTTTPVPTSKVTTTPVPTSKVTTTPATSTPVTLSISHSGTVRPTPRPDYRHFPGLGYYKLHNHTRTWREAGHVCESEGAHLAVPDSQEELDALSSLPSAYPWIGIYRQGQYSPWRTVLGQRLSSDFNIWYGTYPKIYDNCALIYAGSGIINYGCIHSQKFICELNEQSPP